MVNIENAFVTENRSVYEFYQQPGMAFYIPLYQREYSWDANNIEQLLEDISKGIERLAEGDGEEEIRFLGTIITVAENDKNKVQPQDTQALPSKIEKVIDGQQRLSTIAMFASLLYKHISLVQRKIKSSEAQKADIDELCDDWKRRLEVIYSFDLGRGIPRRKPKIIRGQRDKWIRTGPVDGNYNSPVANYLGSFIEAMENSGEFPEPKREGTGETFYRNFKAIDRWLALVKDSHIREDDTFLPAWEILKQTNEENIWLYQREDFHALVDQREKTNKKSVSYILCELVQLFSVCHYLLDRCCFTNIEPKNDDWAFDMFQSLNATGTPLTAIETFKPLVVETVEDAHIPFKDSDNEKNFNKVERLFEKSTTAAQKSKLTTDFLTSFAVAYDGYKLSSHFSHQRKQLVKYFNALETIPEKTEFIKFFGDYAEFYRQWSSYNGAATFPLLHVGQEDSELASILLQYLKEGNHKMSITVLAYFYKSVIAGSPNSIPNFVEAVKCVAAFYTLWRASSSNAALDNAYRDFFKGDENSWTQRPNLTVAELKTHLKDTLANKGIQASKKQDWIDRALANLKYNEARIQCKFALIVSAHDTISDDDKPGLMKMGTKNSAPYLRLATWNSTDLKHIEHVAPRVNEQNWDEALYQIGTDLFESVGNLTLLPANVNISASNRGWQEKHLYYSHLAENDPAKVQQLANKATSSGVTLSSDTIDLLQAASYNNHIVPIVALGESGTWDADFVANRAKRISEILWDRLLGWVL